MPRKRKTKSATIRKDTSSKSRKTAKEKQKERRTRVQRTRNAGTWTEAEYFQKIRSGLRNAFRFWKPIMLALEAASRPYKGGDKRIKKEYKCAHCNKWFQRRMVEVDHIEECGSLSSYDDIVSFIIRLTKEELDSYQVLCRSCHKEKTKGYHQRKLKQKENETDN